jgi:diphosphomevalonate decarboxylase
MISPILTGTALAHPNIALIKYWGDCDPQLHIPVNGSISMNLAELGTQTTVSFDEGYERDEFSLNGQVVIGTVSERVSNFLNRVRNLAGIPFFARVKSENNFPASAGLASSASGFAALSLAASTAAGLRLDEKELSRLARTGSGSACRSIPGGFVEWQAGTSDADSYSFSIASDDYWDIVDCIAVVSRDEKATSSSTGHSMASSSILQPQRVADAPRRLDLCREAILRCDFDQLADIVELDSNLMHAVMITSLPPLLYWQPATIEIMQAVKIWRNEGIGVCYTIDAGPNVHVICTGENAGIVSKRLLQLHGVMEVITTHPGKAARLV